MSIDERKPYPIDEHIYILDFIHMYNSDSISTHIHMHTERLRKLYNTHTHTNIHLSSLIIQATILCGVLRGWNTF